MPTIPLRSLEATLGLIVMSNIFMSFAWYSHLRTLNHQSWWVAAIVSWAIALAEYLLLIPAIRMGSEQGLTTAQLRIIQEVISLVVFVPFMLLFLGEKWRWDYLWAFFCILGAIFFVFRSNRS
jgi:uncharacterized protein (DUF486 family)